MRRMLLAFVAVAVAGCVQQGAVAPVAALPAAGKGEQVVRLAPSDREREMMPQITTKPDGTISIGEVKPVKLAMGTLKVGREDVSFYVPANGPYSTTSAKNDSFENTSTPICVDTNNDGRFSDSETWWSNLPVRLGDHMFVVKEIDPGGSWIRLVDSPAPLAGVVVGKPCPAFSFKTTGGQSVSLADFKGKFLLLDVWSMT